jgi:hypothetical protein
VFVSGRSCLGRRGADELDTTVWEVWLVCVLLFVAARELTIFASCYELLMLVQELQWGSIKRTMAAVCAGRYRKS